MSLKKGGYFPEDMTYSSIKSLVKVVKEKMENN